MASVVGCSTSRKEAEETKIIRDWDWDWDLDSDLVEDMVEDMVEVVSSSLGRRRWVR